MMNNELKKLNKNSIGVYIHIPFCVKKCNYCDFLSFSASEQEKADYINALCKEIRRFCRYRSVKADSVFIGGGTPSVLEPELIERLVNTINECLDCDNNEQEFTIEVNPGTMTEKKAEIYKKSGINRISIGLQSLDNRLLKSLGRIHRRSEFFETYSILRKAGFDNINMDLMFALPGQSFADWKNTVDEALSINPEHISFYSLIIEEGTPFHNDYKSGKLIPVNDEIDRKMYHYAVERLIDNGYHHYEISNAALPGMESVHNLKYWNMEEYVGFGLGAHSYFEGNRFCNTEDMGEYLSIYSCPGEEKAQTYKILNRNTKKDDIEELIFTGLRKTDGILKTRFKEIAGTDIEEVFRCQIDKMVFEEMLEETADRIRLTKKGLDFANYVMSEFII